MKRVWQEGAGKSLAERRAEKWAEGLWGSGASAANRRVLASPWCSALCSMRDIEPDRI